MLRSLLLAALAALLFSPTAFAQTSSGAWPSCANGHGGQYELIFGVVRPVGNVADYAITVRDAAGTVVLDTLRSTVAGAGLDTCVELLSARTILDASTPANGIKLGSPTPAGRLLTFTFEERDPATPGVLPLYSRTFTYNVCDPDDAQSETGFYCSGEPYSSGGGQAPQNNTATDFADYYFFYDGTGLYTVSVNFHDHLGPGKLYKGYEDVFAGEDWVMPYNLTEFCTRVDFTCSAAALDQVDNFMSNQSGDPATGAVHTPILRDWTLGAGAIVLDEKSPQTSLVQNWLWNLSGQTIYFQPRSRITLSHVLTVKDMTLAAADPTAGWFGVRADGGAAEATFDATTVQDVDYTGEYVNPASPFPPYAAVTATAGATVTLDNGSLVDSSQVANGVVASLTGSLITVSGGTEIRRNDGLGALASAGGRVVLTGNSTELRENSDGGVWATGSGSKVDVLARAGVNLHASAYGATSTAGGTVTVATPAGVIGNSSISDNDGGLDTRTSGYQFTGQCGINGCPDGVARVSDNDDLGEKDGRANSASSITAQNTYWGVNHIQQSDLALASGGSSFISVTPLSTTLSNGGGGSGSSKTGGTASQSFFGGGDYEALSPASQARQFALDGDTEAAATLLGAALLVTTDSAERLALYSAAVYLAGRDLTPALRTQLATDAARSDDEGAWAQRALATDAGRRGAADAKTLAETLAGRAGHHAFGHGMLVRLAADTESTALSALAAFAAATGEDASGDDLEALASAVAVVVAAYPDVDLDAALRSVPPTADAKTSGATTILAELAAYPNPSTTRATVALAVSDASDASVMVYDALGRRVAVLHEGALDEGDHAFELDASRLAPGVYVVTARTTSASGSAQTSAVRWTRMR